MKANFENGTLGAKAQGTEAFTGAFVQTEFTNEEVNSGNMAAKVQINAGQTGFPDLGGDMIFKSELHDGNELWIRSYIYYPSSFILTPGGIMQYKVNMIDSNGRTRALLASP